MPVEACSLFINRIHDNRRGGNLRGLRVRSQERVHQQEFASSLASVMLIHCEPAKKGDWNDRIGRQFLDHVVRQIVKSDSEGRQGIVADNCLTVGLLDEDKWRGNPSARILACLFPQITVKCFIAARKVLAVLRFAERLDDQAVGVFLPAIAATRPTFSVADHSFP